MQSKDLNFQVCGIYGVKMEEMYGASAHQAGSFNPETVRVAA